MNSPTPTSPTPKKTTGTGKSDEEGDSTQQGSSASASSSGGKDAIELLKADHREVEQLFSQFQSAKGRQQRKKVIEKIAAALTAHTIIEEEIFYPACREEGVEEDNLDEAQVEHDTVKLLVADLLRGSQDDEYYDAKVTVLSEYVKHHVGEEEKPSDGIFARAKKAELDMDELGQQLQSRKDELMKNEKRLLSRPPKIRSLDLFQHSQEYGDMARYPSDRYRDEENRQGGYRSTGSGYRGDYDDDERNSSISRGSRGEQYYGGMGDSDYGPTRGGYGSSEGGYRGGSSSSGGGYGRGYGGGRDDEQRSRYRGIEQSASGGRYRNYYDDDDSSRSGSSSSSSSGRYLGTGGEDREYYQGTRYGSSYGGGRYGSSDEDDDDNYGRDRYSSGQGYGSRGGNGDYGRGSSGGSGSYRGNR